MNAPMEENTQDIAVHFGAGSIGRGFIGKLLSESGYRVVFVDVQAQIIDALHNQQKYIVEIAHPSTDKKGEFFSESEVSNVDGILSSDQDAINEILCKAELLTTAVGPNILSKIAPIIAIALIYRHAHTHKALNIIACENKVGASTILQHEIIRKLRVQSISTDILNNIGFPNCGVDRIVVASESTSRDLLRVRVEEYFEWTIEETQIVGVTPPIQHANFTANLDAYLERKLFLLNTGHCMLAYLAAIEDIDTIDKAILKPSLFQFTKNAMLESADALSSHWSSLLSYKDLEAYVEKILVRFRNSLLQDAVIRVAREPLRKLGHKDRFMRPIFYCQQYGIACEHLLLGVAAALHYSHETDEDSLLLQSLIKDKGIEHILEKHCRISQKNTRQKIVNFYNTLSQGIVHITI